MKKCRQAHSRRVLRMSRRSATPYSVFFKEYMMKNGVRSMNLVEAAHLVVKRWKEMTDGERSVYVAKCKEEMSKNKLSAKKCKECKLCEDEEVIKAFESEAFKDWKITGYMCYLEDVFDVCGDIEASAEENAVMFSVMWNGFNEEVKDKYRKCASLRLMEQTSKHKKSSKTHKRLQGGSNPQPSVP
ncbi:hypothetical protein CWI42_070300 [Ordospora colligata]|nr:hypothetical protein CWI42_070300 [Ordospora colligata]